MNTKTYASVVNGIVEAVDTIPENLRPGIDIFPPNFAKTLVAVPNGVEVERGWKYNGTAFTPPDVVLPTTDALLILAKKYQVGLQKRGALVNVAPKGQTIEVVNVSVDQRGLTNLQHAQIAGQSDPKHQFAWPLANGGHIDLNVAQINLMFTKATDFLHETTRTLTAIQAAINDGKITTFDQVKNPPASIATWPK